MWQFPLAFIVYSSLQEFIDGEFRSQRKHTIQTSELPTLLKTCEGLLNPFYEVIKSHVN